jgi:hypothetical protein
MPEISRFFGIVISMNYNDHWPPHLHARYGKHKALIALHAPVLIEGYLPPRVLGLIIEWVMLHHDELMQDWEMARRQVLLNKIQPLE